METGWGSWKFDIENEQLLARVLDKFAADLVLRDEIPPSETVSLLSSLSGTAKCRFDALSSSSDEDDDDDYDDIDRDFNAVETTRLPKLGVDNVTAAATVTAEKVREPSPVIAHIPDTLFIPSQRPVFAENATTKLIVELLNGGNYDPRELRDLLTIEKKNRATHDMSEIVRDVWPEIVTDGARHGLCEALLDMDVRPQIVCEQIYWPWFERCGTQLTGFIDSVSKLIVRFPDYACKSFLVDLLKDVESILAKHLDWLAEIMKSLDCRHWCILLSEYTAEHCCDVVLDRRRIPVLSYMVKHCHNGSMDDDEAGRLVALCRNAVPEHSANRDFAVFLVSVIGAVDLAKFRPEITAICALLKGASKILTAKALKDAK